jgi:UPF0271 protein
MRIDLNADVGEGRDDADEQLVPLVTSVNIACGAHAGDRGTMARTIALARRHGASIGAHPGYPDKEGFGRRELALADAELEATLREQLTALLDEAVRQGATLSHVKPHGALYNSAAADAGLARRVARAVLQACGPVTLVGLAGSRLLDEGRAAGLPVAAEAFADRAYEPDGTLRPRSRPGALLRDPAAVARQAVAIACERRVAFEDGGTIELEAETLCLHGDTPGAVANARAVREALAASGVAIAPLGRGR